MPNPPDQHSSRPSRDNDRTEPTPNVSPWAHASTGLQLAATLLLGFYLGYRIDAARGTSPWFTLACAMAGLAIGLYVFLRRFLHK